MRRALNFFFLISFSLVIHAVIAQTGSYKINIQINGTQDSVAYLVSYYGDKTFIQDTAFAGSQGAFIFEGDSSLPQGIYIIAGSNNNRLLEVILDEDQHFSLKTDVTSLIDGVSIEGSEENTLFYDYIRFNTDIVRKIKALETNDLSNDTLMARKQEDQIDSLYSLLNEYKHSVKEEHPGSFLASLFRAMKKPDGDEIKEAANPREYLKTHYWDHFDFEDVRLLRTPIFSKRVNEYFTEVVYQHPDSIIQAIDGLINKARNNREIFKYLVWYLTFKYETSNIMGFDEIFVHMADRYYGAGEAFWADSLTVAAIRNKANGIRPVLLGNKAPNLILMDTSGKFVSLHHIDSDYVIVLFYEIDCGHCKKEIEELKDFYDASDRSIEVFAVCTDTSFSAWKDFIENKELNWVHANGTRSITPDYHQLYNISMTPTLFLLDRNKKIIAKRIKTGQIKGFLDNYEALANEPE